MRARAGPEAEIQGSGSETGEVVKDPERPAGSKAAGRNEAVWGGRSWRPQTTCPPLVWDNRTRERNPSRGSWVPGLLDLRAEGLETHTCILKKGRIMPSVTKGRGGRGSQIAGVLLERVVEHSWSWGEREESHVLRFLCVPDVESGTFSSGFLHFTGVGITEERPGVGWQGT